MDQDHWRRVHHDELDPQFQLFSELCLVKERLRRQSGQRRLA